MAVKPINPDEVVEQKKACIPDAVIEAFNDEIARRFLGNSATVKQDDVLARIQEKGIERGMVFDNGWLDVEDIYRKAGWEVFYDKPGYNETYASTFKFTRKKKD